MKARNLKLIWVVIISIGGILVGMVLDAFILGQNGSSDIISLIIGSFFILYGAWGILRS